MKYVAWIFMLFFIGGCAASIPSEATLQKMSPKELNQLSVDLWNNGKYSDPELALKYSKLAAEKDPAFDRAYYSMGYAYYDLKQYEKSIQNFSKAIELNPKIADSYNGRGWVYGTINDYQNAINDFTKAIELKPDFKLAYNNRARAYLETKADEKACSDFKKVCDLGDCSNIEYGRKIGKCK